MPLSAVAIKSAKPKSKPYKIPDSGGLYLLVTPTGSRLWRLDYRFAGKRNTLAMGAFPLVGLAEARDQRDDAKRSLREGRDPSRMRRNQKTGVAADHTFAKVAQRWFEARKSGWVEAYRKRIWSRIEADVISQIGEVPIDAIGPGELLDVLRKIEGRGAVETARRVKNYVNDVFSYAKSGGLVTKNPAEEIAGALATPAPAKHRTALKARDLPEFLKSLHDYDGDKRTAEAIWFTILTFVRTNEIRFAQWEEFEDLKGAAPLWRIPAARMKMRNEHLVPLAPPAVAALVALRRHSEGSELVLPAKTQSGVISENTMLFALYRMGYHHRATIHGFRGMASTILNEKGFNRDWIERQLAHVERDEVRAAYNAAEWLAQRREMMRWWATFLEAGGEMMPAPLSPARRAGPPRIRRSHSVEKSFQLDWLTDHPAPSGLLKKSPTGGR